MKEVNGRRAGAALTREAIVAAALQLVDEVGLAQLSTRRLGERLGCEAMSIYHHLPSKHHLLDAMVDAAIGSMRWPAAALPPREALRDLMYAYREMAHRHAALFPLVATHRLNTPTGIRFIEGVLERVQAVLPGTEVSVRHFRVIGYFLMGACLDETSGYARGPSAAEPVDDAFVAREAPRLARGGHLFARDQWDATFELGVQAMLAAVQAAAPAGSGEPIKPAS